MYEPHTATSHDDWSRNCYKVKVRHTAPPQCLWGSAGLKNNISFPKPLLLHIRNDVFGAPVTFGTQTVAGAQTAQTTMGILQPGECVSIPIQDISGVFAWCTTTESTVYCLIRASA